MELDGQGYISIVELIIYVPVLVLSVIVCSRHGLHRSSGWIYTLLLALVRIVGAGCQLGTYNNDSNGLLEATLIFDSVGISPLLLATLGMLSRQIDWINSKRPQTFDIKQFRFVQLVITLGMILSIVGGTSSSPSPNGTITFPGTSKAGIILYFVAFAALLAIFLFAIGYKNAIPAQESRISVAVGIALPFILVRLLYSALAIFLHTHDFSILGGSAGVRAGMTVVEELFVVMDYLVLGFSLPRLESKEDGELATRQQEFPRNQNRRNKPETGHSR